MKKICYLIILFFFLASPAFAGTTNLPRTGQTKCYDTSGTEIACTDTGQDGDIQAGVAWPEPRFTDNGDGTMTDNLTGLMWTKDANLPNEAKDWFHALNYCNNLNLGGHSDWRLPNVNEMESLVNANEVPAGWLNTQGFINVQVNYIDGIAWGVCYYWSSTSGASDPGLAWLVCMWDGTVYGNYKSTNIYVYVWPVRGGQCGSLENSVICLPQTGQKKCYDTNGTEIPCPGTGQDGEIRAGVAWPSPRFIDNGDGTVTDNLTGLMWTKDANLSNGYMNWQPALDYVKGMNNGTHPNYGYTDWRLSNRKELHSLTDYSKYNPALPAGHPFTDVDYGYWSSTSWAGYPDHAWWVCMWDGEVLSGTKSGYIDYVWPVRSGQSGSTCTTWNEVISKYNSYVSGQAGWNDVIACYNQYVSQ